MAITNLIWCVIATVFSIFIAFFISLILRSMIQTPKGSKPTIIKSIFSLKFIKESLHEFL